MKRFFAALYLALLGTGSLGFFIYVQFIMWFREIKYWEALLVFLGGLILSLLCVVFPLMQFYELINSKELVEKNRQRSDG